MSSNGGRLWRILAGTLVSQAALGVARPTITYLAISLHADPFTIGVIVAAYGLVPMALAIPVGRLAGRLRHLAIVPSVSSALLVLGCVLPMTMRGTLPLVIASALLGAAGVGIALGTQSWITRQAAPDRYVSGFGWQSAWASLGQGIGPILAGAIIGPGALSNDRILWSFAAATALAVVTLIALTSRVSHAYPQDQHEKVSVLRTPGIFRYIFLSTSVLASIELLTAYLPVIGEHSGIAPTMIGIILGARGVASMLSRLALAPLARRWSSSVVLVASTAGSAATVIVPALTQNPMILLIALTLAGAFLGLAQPLTISEVAAALPPRSRSAGLGIRMFGNQVAQTTVPIVAGALAVAVGVGSIFVAQALWLGASSLWEWSSKPGPTRE